MKAIFLAILVTIFAAAHAGAQEFECKIVTGADTTVSGVEIWGVNKHPRVIRCEVTCNYWKPDGSEGYQKCSADMQPNSPSTKYCFYNLNDAKTVIGVSHSCE
jgi:hypothetical protein